MTLSPLVRDDFRRLGAGEGDLALYRAEMERGRAGEGYYQVAAAELPARGYPTRSVFNWRFPLPNWLLAKLPSVVWGKAMLGLLALAVVMLAFEALSREQGHGFGRPALCALLLTGTAMPCVLGDLFLSPELWAGTWIALSLCFYGLDRPYAGVGAGLAAVFFRELALPYCLIAAAIAWREKRYRELTAWIVGLTAWAVVYGLHCWHVSGLIAPNAEAHAQGWVQFGGAAFVVSTVRMNAYLINLPLWLVALYFAASMLGLAGWNTRLGLRCGLTAAAMVLMMAVVGQDFNVYWGSLTAPLFCFGAARFLGSMVDLWKAGIVGHAERGQAPSP